MHYKRYKSILLSHGTMNLTRGCVHGCIYCDSRSDCYQFDHPFSDIEIKTDAAEILDQELSKKRKKFMIKTGAMTDPYMPIEAVLKQTRDCFNVVHKHHFGLSFQTKSTLFLDDLDLLESIHLDSRLVVQMTITTCDDDLCRIVEPGVEVTSERIQAIKILKAYNIPVIVWISPLLPWINNDLDNLKCILSQCQQAGVKGFIWYGPGLTLRKGNREYFYQKLDQLFPGLKKHYQRVYGDVYQVQSKNASVLNDYFISFCQSHDLLYKHEDVYNFINYFNEKKYEQLQLF